MVKLLTLFGLPHVTTALPYPMTEGSYRYGGAPLTGCSLTFGPELLQFTCPPKLRLHGIMHTKWRYEASPKKRGYYHEITVWDEKYQKQWPQGHKLKMKEDAMEVVLDTDHTSYSFQWTEAPAPGHVSVNLHEVGKGTVVSKSFPRHPSRCIDYVSSVSCWSPVSMPLPSPAALLSCGLLLTCCGIVRATTNTIKVHGRSVRSSSSSSGLGSSISSFSLNSRRSDVVSLDSVDSAFTVSPNLWEESCPKTTGYYFGNNSLVGCRLAFRRLDLHSSRGVATWTCPKRDRFGINERWTFEDVVFDKPVDSTLPEFYYMHEMVSDRGGGIIFFQMHQNCEKIMISRGLFRFDFLNWGQFIEGSATDDDDDGKLPLRAVGYYLGQGRFEGCKIKMRLDSRQRRVVKMDCTDTSKTPPAFRKKLSCFSFSSRISTTPDFDPFATRYSGQDFGRLGLSVLGSAADLTDYSLAVSDNGLFLRLAEEAAGLQTLFEWERHDLAIPQRKIHLPQPRLEGYYFGQKGPYERCYFQFRAAHKQFVSMRCPRDVDRASTTSDFAGQRFLYGVKNSGGPLYYELDLYTEGREEVNGSRVMVRHDGSAVRLSFTGYEDPFYFPWAPHIGEDGKAAGLPTPKEDGYYTNDKGEGKEDILRFENGTVSVHCASEKKGCRTMGLIGPYFYRVILGWSTEDTRMPEYLRLELVDRSNLQPLVMGVAELNLRRDGGAVQVKTIDGEVVLFSWRPAEEGGEEKTGQGSGETAGENDDSVRSKLRRGSTKKKKMIGRGLSFMKSRKESNKLQK